MKKLIKVLSMMLIIFGMLAVNTVTANAEWRNNSKGWWYTEGDSYVKDCWKEINEKWYYFDYDGYMKTGWNSIENNWYYFDEDGEAYRGWQYIDEGWYYFGLASCRMMTGWITDNIKLNSYGDRLVSQKFYYLNNDGLLDDSKTTYVMPDEIKAIFDKIKYFEPEELDQTYFDYKDFSNDNIITDKYKMNGQIYNFFLPEDYGLEYLNYCYEKDTGNLSISHWSLYLMINTNQLYDTIEKKGEHLLDILEWAFSKQDNVNIKSPQCFYYITEERDKYVVDRYIYEDNNFNSKYEGKYYYNKSSGEIVRK